jgi:hypothetical protein
MISSVFDSNVIRGGYRDLPATIEPGTRRMGRTLR